MPFDPTEAVGEILGLRARTGVDPTATAYHCPIVGKLCVKSKSKGVPYPVCSIRNAGGLVAVCPKRLYQAPVMNDVIKHCWPGDPPANPVVAREVTMHGFGNVDFVIADVDPDTDTIRQFLSVEVQAIDITGSVRPAYNAILAGQDLPRAPTYGLNWDNVYKRYVTQLIRKGYFHHHWGTKIVGVMQDVVYRNIVERFEFLRTDKVRDPAVNVIFLTYRIEEDAGRPGEYRFVMDTVEGTSHANLQQAVLYAAAPSRDEFSDRVMRAIKRDLAQGRAVEANVDATDEDDEEPDEEPGD